MTGDGHARTAVVVVSYGAPELLLRNAAMTSSASSGSTLFVVVDSWSSDAVRERTREIVADHGWELVAPGANVGFGVGCNLGVDRARELGAETVVLVNPDLALTPRDLEVLVRRVHAEPDALVAPRVVRPDGSPYAAGIIDLRLVDGTMRASGRRPTGEPVEAYQEWLSGACLACTVDLWDRVGGFDPRYFLYWEDVDLSRRVLEAGGRLVVADDAVAVHDEGGTQSRTSPRAKSATYYRYSLRNRLLYASIWLDDAGRDRWRRTALRAARSVVLQGGRRQLLTSTVAWRAAWGGTRDGLRLLRSATSGPKR